MTTQQEKEVVEKLNTLFLNIMEKIKSQDDKMSYLKMEIIKLKNPNITKKYIG